MMKKITYKAKIAMSMLGLLAGLSMLAFGIAHRSIHHKPETQKKTAPPQKTDVLTYDTILLKKFNGQLHSLDFNKVSCTYSGLIDMVDGTDSTNTLHNLQFRFCREGRSFYYQVGQMETINRNGLNVFIANDQKKVVVSLQQYEVKSPVQTTAVVEKVLRSEGYILKSAVSGQTKSLYILNEHHITCKELKVTYDTVSDKLQGIYMRLSDFNNVLDKKRDRVIGVQLSEIENKGNIGLYPMIDEVITKATGQWKLTPKYSGYELILL